MTTGRAGGRHLTCAGSPAPAACGRSGAGFPCVGPRRVAGCRAKPPLDRIPCRTTAAPPPVPLRPMPTLADSIAARHLDPDAAAYLRAAIAARRRILLCGHPSSGATSLFHALLAESLSRHPGDDHVLVAVGPEEPPVAGPRLRVTDSVFSAREYAPAALFVEEVMQHDAVHLFSLWSRLPISGDPRAGLGSDMGGCAVLTTDDAPSALARLAGYLHDELQVVVRADSFLDVVVGMSPGRGARISELDPSTGGLRSVSLPADGADYDLPPGS